MMVQTLFVTRLHHKAPTLVILLQIIDGLLQICHISELEYLQRGEPDYLLPLQVLVEIQR